MLVNEGCRSLDVGRMNGQGLLMSHKSAIRMQKRMALQLDKDISIWKENIEEKELMMMLLLELKQHVTSEGINVDALRKCSNFKEQMSQCCCSFICTRRNIPQDDVLNQLRSKESLMAEINAIRGTVNDFW